MRANRDISRRLSFDQFAQLYDTARPRLGRLITSDLMRFAGIPRGTRVLDVGAGTGQWVDGLLHYGNRVDALEPGAAMRAILRNEFSHRGASIHEGDFENAEFPSSSFGAIVSSNAFHWLDPEAAYTHAASLLRSDGKLLLVWHYIASADDDALAAALRQALPAEHQDLADLLGPPSEEWLAEGRAELIASGAFGEPKWQWFEAPASYDAAGFIDLLASYANSEPMDEQARAEAAARCAELVDPDLLASLTNKIYAVTAPVLTD